MKSEWKKKIGLSHKRCSRLILNQSLEWSLHSIERLYFLWIDEYCLMTFCIRKEELKDFRTCSSVDFIIEMAHKSTKHFAFPMSTDSQCSSSSLRKWSIGVVGRGDRTFDRSCSWDWREKHSAKERSNNWRIVVYRLVFNGMKSFYFIFNKIHNGVKIEFDQWTHQSETSSQIERRFVFPRPSFFSSQWKRALSQYSPIFIVLFIRHQSETFVVWRQILSNISFFVQMNIEESFLFRIEKFLFILMSNIRF